MTQNSRDLWKLQQRDLIRVGNSLAIIIHKDERKKLGVGENDQLTVKIFDDGRIILEPQDL